MNYNWFCYYHGTPTDAKLSLIAKKAGARRCEMTAFWDCLLDHASQNPDRGFVGDIDLEVIAFAQDVTHETLQALHALLIKKELIVNGYLANWDKRQNPHSSKTSTERVRRFRDKQLKKQNNNNSITNDETHDETHETKCNDETPTRQDIHNKESKITGSRFALTSLPDEWRQFCTSKRPDLDPEELFAEFGDFWRGVPGARGRKLDWFATWRNRVRDKKPNHSHAPPARPQPLKPTAITIQAGTHVKTTAIAG